VNLTPCLAANRTPDDVCGIATIFDIPSAMFK
jgi:hypothetical protein